MLNRLLYRLTANLPCRLIPLPSGPYLERYYVGQVFGWTLYLHRFVRADSERHLHNHPWWHGFAVVLTGWYVESRAVDFMHRLQPFQMITEEHTVRWYNRVDGNTLHRITDVKPGTWTLFCHGQRARVRMGSASVPKGWGFIERGEFKPATPSQSDWWLTAPKGRDAGRESL